MMRDKCTVSLVINVSILLNSGQKVYSQIPSLESEFDTRYGYALAI